MRIHADRFRRMAEARGITPEQLGEAVQRTGLQGERAAAAVRNWMRGRDHPRCKSTDITRLAGALGCEVAAIARFTAEVRYHRGSPRKCKLLIDLVRGRRVDEAITMLSFNPKRAAVNVRKAISAAVADAEQARADVSSLVVAESRVDTGPQIKRFQPKDRGRSHPIIKPLAHITISLEERGE